MSVVAIPSWLTATMTANAHTAVRATVARTFGFVNPASAVAPRTRLASAVAASPPITSTTMATTRLGSQSRSCRSTSDTAGSPSASNATTRTMSRTNHLATDAITPAASVSGPILFTKSLKPERRARSLKWTARNRADTPLASSEARNHPTSRMTRKPMIRGMAPKKRARALVSDTRTLSPQSRTL